MQYLYQLFRPSPPLPPPLPPRLPTAYLRYIQINICMFLYLCLLASSASFFQLGRVLTSGILASPLAGIARGRPTSPPCSSSFPSSSSSSSSCHRQSWSCLRWSLCWSRCYWSCPLSCCQLRQSRCCCYCCFPDASSSSSAPSSFPAPCPSFSFSSASLNQSPCQLSSVSLLPVLWSWLVSQSWVFCRPHSAARWFRWPPSRRRRLRFHPPCSLWEPLWRPVPPTRVLVPGPPSGLVSLLSAGSGSCQQCALVQQSVIPALTGRLCSLRPPPLRDPPAAYLHRNNEHIRNVNVLSM